MLVLVMMMIITMMMMLVMMMDVETDTCLVEDTAFKSLVDSYASNQTMFFADYAEVG